MLIVATEDSLAEINVGVVTICIIVLTINKCKMNDTSICSANVREIQLFYGWLIDRNNNKSLTINDMICTRKEYRAMRNEFDTDFFWEIFQQWESRKFNTIFYSLCKPPVFPKLVFHVVRELCNNENHSCSIIAEKLEAAGAVLRRVAKSMCSSECIGLQIHSAVSHQWKTNTF